MYGRYRIRIAKTEIVELVKLHRRFAEAVHLVYCKDNRLSAFQKHLCDCVVIGCNTASYICNKNDNVSFFYRKLGLSSHLCKDNIVALRLDTASINYHELLVTPLTF